MSGQIPTVAVKAVLVSFDFSSKRNAYYKTRCSQLETLGKAVRSDFDNLKRSGHPKWKEVNLEQEIGIWQRDRCSSPNAPKNMAKTVSPTAMPTADQDNLMQAIENILTSDSR